jgi:hypothetical protein
MPVISQFEKCIIPSAFQNSIQHLKCILLLLLLLWNKVSYFKEEHNLQTFEISVQENIWTQNCLLVSEHEMENIS